MKTFMWWPLDSHFYACIRFWLPTRLPAIGAQEEAELLPPGHPRAASAHQGGHGVRRPWDPDVREGTLNRRACVRRQCVLLRTTDISEQICDVSNDGKLFFLGTFGNSLFLTKRNVFMYVVRKARIKTHIAKKAVLSPPPQYYCTSEVASFFFLDALIFHSAQSASGTSKLFQRRRLFFPNFSPHTSNTHRDYHYTFLQCCQLTYAFL